MINYYLITKPGIIMGNLVTVAAGFLLASQNKIDPWLFLATLFGLGFIIASACVFNNYIDRNLDKQMSRTKNRALASGRISSTQAICFAILLGIIGNFLLFAYTNLLTALIANVGFFIYVVIYSIWKRHTIYGTAIGSIAGAVPPVIGYCAVSNHLDMGALILFAIMVLWQMPHFFAIALLHLKDYTAANVPVLPVKKSIFRTKIHMVLYILGFILATSLLTYYQYTGQVYLIVTLAIGLIWLALCLKGFKAPDAQVWGRHMFRFSLVTIMATCIMMSLD